MRPLILTFLLAAGLACPGCTLEDGDGFAHLSGKLYSIFSGVAPGNSRLQSDGWFKTADSFELKLDKLTLQLRYLRLQSEGSAAVSSAGCSFDPSNPPAGCGLCHGGHCHCDGKLVSYEDLKARACGGATASATLSTLKLLLVPRDQELLGSGTQNWDLACAGSCELKQGSASQLSVELEKLSMAAQVRDRSAADRLGGKTYKVMLSWPLAGAALTHKFKSSLSLDRDHPHMLDLAVMLPVSDKLLDGIEWHKLIADKDTINIDSTKNKTAGQTIATSLAGSTLKLVVTREE